jgi:nitric oxide reductase activation protein
VLILAGVYSTYSKWINIEIALAQEMGKRIIAIEPWGSERTSSAVKNAADKIVKWNTDSIVGAIRGY